MRCPFCLKKILDYNPEETYNLKPCCEKAPTIAEATTGELVKYCIKCNSITITGCPTRTYKIIGGD